ncbi:serine--tRNA ligase [Patescibacteria group bacterium]|nr:serine--tRNA ligase [Patescibacteria group bacterium]MBU4274471.1 serine--tRNA ligase [Patescibacteria group bacterium]MBU4367930.1 serine--tRNA ligase [Patescibacteria group bacterium]MBU4462268.1 serine--tRNA ligase [Patescibacteria group bacterium]MCG2699540.1 serine--tRNA ligase [Candidatus Parcubacteria bacterium]
MLDIKFIRQNPQIVKDACQKKQVKVDVDLLLKLDLEKRSLINLIETNRANQNKLGKNEIEEAKKIKEAIKKIEPNLKNIEGKLNVLLSVVPNIPFDDVPLGKDDSQNVVIKKCGKIPKFNFQPKQHSEIGKNLDIIDIERASKIAGTRFYYLKNEGALLERALVNFAFDILVKKGFIPVIPPVMMKEEMALGTGYFEAADKEEAYFLEKDKLFLVGTAEQPLVAMHANETLLEKDLPKRYIGFSTCFRREAGSYGKDTKGILRVHQFDKAEMVVFSKPEDSKKEHELLLSIEEELMKKLNIPYQVINICTGDLGRPAAKKYDIEAWLPTENKYRETHSTSNCTDFQARRLEIRYRGKNNKLNFVHTLNGTAFSMRPIIAILENFQQKDGSVKIPKVLHKYTGFKIIKPK